MNAFTSSQPPSSRPPLPIPHSTASYAFQICTRTHATTYQRCMQLRRVHRPAPPLCSSTAATRSSSSSGLHITQRWMGARPRPWVASSAMVSRGRYCQFIPNLTLDARLRRFRGSKSHSHNSHSQQDDFIEGYNRVISQQDDFIGVLDTGEVNLEGVGLIDVGHLWQCSGELNQAFDLKVRMTAYWKIVKKRLIDSIALHLMLRISNFVNKDLEKEIVHELLSPSGGGIERLLEKSPSVFGKRENL